ncbi:unnamed protein product [Nesidiocoris tenuis]|uniref:Uncharacterized protein n=1 Tax=Nesidiocoris tenuis TaxID=355587 RepID=A0A6H5HB43_9HEMI|nr:unnamed protein product [Nesidiocoris tenuis]CAB0015166.1 unnamed protein product [Nesidiocoris tenuis]
MSSFLKSIRVPSWSTTLMVTVSSFSPTTGWYVTNAGSCRSLYPGSTSGLN